MLQNLNYDSICESLWEIGENGDAYGYEWDAEGYYREYEELFSDLSEGATNLLEAIHASDVREQWDELTVALLGKTQKVLGYNSVEMDYYGMLSYEEDWAEQEAERKVMQMTKADMVRRFKKVLAALMSYADLKAAHDCLTSIVTELDERGAAIARRGAEIGRLYANMTDSDETEFEKAIQGIPQRMWLE